MLSEVAYLQNEHERKTERIQQAIEEYVQGNPETTVFRFFLPSTQDLDEVKQAAARTSLSTRKRIDLIYPTDITTEE